MYHYSKNLENNKPAWAREVHSDPSLNNSVQTDPSQYKFSCCVSQVEERSKQNRQGSPKICTTVSDTNIQSRSESISQSGASQTPPMQRPVEPQGGQGKVCDLSFYSLCIRVKCKLSYSARMQCEFLLRKNYLTTV